MQKYINQLIEDLEQVAQNPPRTSYIEPPPGFEDNRYVVELAQVPFKPISEWTGIDCEVFPEVIQLDAGQCQMVIDAIFKIFMAMNIELVDKPEDIPPELLYMVLVDNWDHPIQYLPVAGYDLELCTGDPATCEYGEYCFCSGDYGIDLDDLPPDSSILNNDDDDNELPF